MVWIVIGSDLNGVERSNGRVSSWVSSGSRAVVWLLPLLLMFNVMMMTLIQFLEGMLHSIVTSQKYILVCVRVWQEAYFNFRDKKKFFPSISCFEKRTRISFFNLGLQEENENRGWDNYRENCSRNTFFARLMFKKMLLISKIFIKSYFFSQTNWMNFFETN